MGGIISYEEVKAIGCQRQEEARLTRPHTGRLPEPVNPLDGWKRAGERLARHASSRRCEGIARLRVH